MKKRIIFTGFLAVAIFIVAALAGTFVPPMSAQIEFNAENTGGEIDERDLANPKMLWGETTNLITGETHVSGTFGSLPPVKTSFRSGIDTRNGLIVVSLAKNAVPNPVYRAIENTSTNLVDACLPEYNERFLLVMTNTNGVAVQKTKEGLDIGKPDTLKPQTRHSQAKHYLPMWPTKVFMQEIDPAKYFALEKPGLYKLTLAQRLYVVNTNAFLETITLPPVTVDVRVEN